MSIHLFLSHADDNRPVLRDGIPELAAFEAPLPTVPAAPIKGARVISAAAPPNDLVEQGWAVVAPKGPRGDRLLEIIEPLRKKRAQDQDAEPLVYRVDPAMSATAAAEWMRQSYWNAVDRHEDQLPRYLLLLGDADAVSWELQQTLGGRSFVGRLALPNDQGYEAYVEKVLRWEQEEPVAAPRMIFYTVRDGSGATTDGYIHLMRPSVEAAQKRAGKSSAPAAEIVEIGVGAGFFTVDDLLGHAEQMLREAASARGGVLFSVSHGTGAPGSGWASSKEQRAYQGSIVLSRFGDRMTAMDLSSRPFLPGGVWLLFACYGAGTPAVSAYYPWLSRLNQLGRYTVADHVLRGLPKSGDAPFTAALPQAALMNPDGPLGVIGHVDLAWTWSFLEHPERPASSDGPTVQSRAERFQGILRALSEGHRIGVAHYDLARFHVGLSAELSAFYEEDARLEMAPDAAAEDSDRKAKRAGLWMQRQDVGAYVLLGDPAARAPLAHAPPGCAPSRPSGRSADELRRLENAVLEALRSSEPKAAIAERHGLAEAALERGVAAFLLAGRAALTKLR